MINQEIPQTSKEIIEVPIEQLKPFPKNPRVWDDVDEAQLTESIQKFGILQPLIINNAVGKENRVIGGNFRLEIYKKLGVQLVPVIYVTIEDEAKERELNLRLNRNQGDWDWELLKEYKIDDLINVGFDEIDLGKYWDSELAVENDHFDLKKAKEEVLKNPVAKLGDLFQLGNHKIICGNSTDPEVVKRLVGDNLIHYINSDPPFNIGLNYSKGVGNNSDYGGQEKDKRTEDEYKQFLKTSIENALSVSQPDTHVFYWSDETRVGILQQIYKELGIENKRLCIWIKNNQSVTPKIAFNKMTEYCVYGVRGKPYLNENLRNLNEIQNREIASGNRSADDIFDLLNIWLVDRLPATEYVHPTMKNLTLYEKALRRCTKIGDYVLDLFGGSGSQLIASEQLKRRALLVELDPVFVDIILLRYEQFSGVKPVNLIKDGNIFQIGKHILGCGKAEDGSLLEKMLQGRKINLVVTDVPYGCDYVNGKQGFSQLANQTSIVNDQIQSEQEYTEFTKSWLHTVKPHLSLPNSIYVFNTDKMAFAVKQALEAEGGKFSQLLIWAKNHNVIGRLDYNPQHELIIYGWIGKHEFYKSKDKSVLCFPKPNRSKLHPTMKPVPLLRHLILNSSRIGEVVWDGFGGSGSTMVAAEQTRRICIMTELAPNYCQTIINRMRRIFPELIVNKL